MSVARITEPSGQVCVAGAIGAGGGGGGGATYIAGSGGAEPNAWRTVNPIVRGWPTLYPSRARPPRSRSNDSFGFESNRLFT